MLGQRQIQVQTCFRRTEIRFSLRFNYTLTMVLLKQMQFFVVFISLTGVIYCESNLFESTSQPEVYNQDYVEGKRQYEKLARRIDSDYGRCWKAAVSNLHAGCKHLTEDTQSRLALSFANCFLENAGSETCPCSVNDRLPDCLKNADNRVFSTFTEFFTHTQSMCHFLQHQVWQEKTENTIFRLSSNSEKISQQLQKSSKSQSTMLHLQQIALGKQHELINTSEIGLKQLNFELEKSRDSVKNVFDEFKSTTDEQRLLIFTVFDKIKKLETLVMGEFTGFYTFLYYFLSVFLSYLLTSTPRTANARLYLIILFTANAVLERIIVSYNIEEESEKHVLLEADGPIYQRIWICRKAFCCLSCIMLLVSFYLYKDYNIINNRLLMNIQKQNVEMQNFIRCMGINTSLEKKILNQSISTSLGDSIISNNVAPSTTEEADNRAHLVTSLTHSALSPIPLPKTSTPNAQLVATQKNVEAKKKRVEKKRIEEKPNNTQTCLLDSTNMSQELHPRYNFRPRSRPLTPDNLASRSASPLSISRYISSAEKTSRLNKDWIHAKFAK